MIDRRPQLVRNRIAKCASCKGRTPALRGKWDLWMIYHKDQLFCIPCAAAISGHSQETLIGKLRPSPEKLYPFAKQRKRLPQEL